MSWTKQHFELIADTVNEEVDNSGKRSNLCETFANKLEPKNDFFDKSKFMNRCVGEVGVGLLD